MTPAFRYTLLWIFGSLVLVVVALTPVSSARIGERYNPSNTDAFCRHRILDIVTAVSARRICAHDFSYG